ncbi:DNA-binding protein [Xanthomonas euvesicatoria]
MGRTTDLTNEEVAEAILAVMGAGLRPSWEAVREEVGRGSPVVLNTKIARWFELNGPRLVAKAPTGEQLEIDDYLAKATEKAYKAFEARQAERLEQLDNRAASQDVRERLLDEMEQALAQRELGQRELIDELREQVRRAQAERDDALGAHGDRDIAIAEANQRIAHLKDSLAESGQRESNLRGEAENCARKIAELETRVAQAGELLLSKAQQCEEAEARLAATTEAIGSLQDGIVREAKLVQKQLAELHAMSERSADHVKALHAAATRSEELAVELATVRAEAAAASDSAHATRTELDALALANAGLKDELASAVARYTRQAEELRVQSALREQLQVQNDSMVEALPALLKKIKGSGATP